VKCKVYFDRAPRLDLVVLIILFIVFSFWLVKKHTYNLIASPLVILVLNCLSKISSRQKNSPRISNYNIHHIAARTASTYRSPAFSLHTCQYYRFTISLHNNIVSGKFPWQHPAVWAHTNLVYYYAFICACTASAAQQFGEKFSQIRHRWRKRVRRVAFTIIIIQLVH